MHSFPKPQAFPPPLHAIPPTTTTPTPPPPPPPPPHTPPQPPLRPQTPLQTPYHNLPTYPPHKRHVGTRHTLQKPSIPRPLSRRTKHQRKPQITPRYLLPP